MLQKAIMLSTETLNLFFPDCQKWRAFLSLWRFLWATVLNPFPVRDSWNNVLLCLISLLSMMRRWKLGPKGGNPMGVHWCHWLSSSSKEFMASLEIGMEEGTGRCLQGKNKGRKESHLGEGLCSTVFSFWRGFGELGNVKWLTTVTINIKPHVE